MPASDPLLAGKVGRFDAVTPPEMPVLWIEGQGDPGHDPAYGRAVSALYKLSYAVRFAGKALGHDIPVGPLEGLWWADDMADFHAGHRARWRWRMLIRQPAWLKAPQLDRLRAEVERKLARDPEAATDAASLAAAQLETFDEGACLQTLHLGPYTAEAPLIARLHAEIATRGWVPRGLHHEIYLNDPGRTAPEKLRTILRQPVEPAP